MKIGYVTSGIIFLTFLVFGYLWAINFQEEIPLYTWLNYPELNIPFTLVIDHLSLLMGYLG